MLVEGLSALAAAGGGAVVQAAGTDAWNGLRQRVGDLFGRGDSERARAEFVRLDRTAAALAEGTPADLAGERARQEGVWQGRFENLLENLDAPGQRRAVEQLRELLVFVAAAARGPGGPGPTVPGTEDSWQGVFGSGSATASHGGTAVTGIYNDHSTVSLPSSALRPPAEVEARAGMDELAHQARYFTGRGVELDRLDAALSVPGVALVQAVHGLGGVGKSALAAHWVATRPHGRSPVRWITADSPAGVQQGLSRLATALQPALAKALTAEALAEYAVQWLATHTGWLLVLDNVNDPADIAGLITRAPGGRFLITSRLATAWTDVSTLIRLDIMTPAESLALLTRITTAGNGSRDLDGAAELCEELGHLPLAVEQAAAYLAQNPLVTPRAYLGLLAEYPADMYGQGAATTPAERTVAQVWNITLDQVTRLQPAAADLLRTLAWYAPDEIPAALAHVPAGPPAVSAAIGLLTAYNMITPDPATSTVSVHRLVQALTRTPDPNDPHRTPDLIAAAREQATENLSKALPKTISDPASWPTWRTLTPHVDALADQAAQETDTATTARILNETGLFLKGQGLITPALRHLHRAATGSERVLGKDHPDTLTSRNNLASAYESAGDLDRAIPLLKRTLTERVRVLGENHPGTLTSRNNLAGAYQAAGDLDRAIQLFEQTLTDSERVLGEDHPDTLTFRNNLAYSYQAAGDLSRAIQLYEQTLTNRVRLLGKDHPDTLMSRNNLASAYESAGDLDQAIPLLERTLTDCERVLGKHHPDTLTSRNNLASAYESAGDLDQAIPLYEQTLTNRVRLLGKDHPDTLLSRNNLAYTYRSAGDLDQAIPLFERTLADCERVLSEGHPLVGLLRGNLAAARAERDDGSTGRS
ncbi:MULTISPECIES: FxSxx-COOH system tetratricopeptide repeat protein [unclassified Streptomyces]|uniref:FxSxx-COOH system tetratricopeptide repeat protein n=1 Tax=unclassified Streptomyces TaxID=2593676 RepID=UPI002E28320B|nr:FxSxx-COOH system tetratricopeptide repeat protein [Streptomyces sp. NBC_00223]